MSKSKDKRHKEIASIRSSVFFSFFWRERRLKGEKIERPRQERRREEERKRGKGKGRERRTVYSVIHLCMFEGTKKAWKVQSLFALAAN